MVPPLIDTVDGETTGVDPFACPGGALGLIAQWPEKLTVVEETTTKNGMDGVGQMEWKRGCRPLVVKVCMI